ncbi:MAG: NAD-dependent epimerase/dehydratase family protein [Caldilineaceae bacterium]
MKQQHVLITGSSGLIGSSAASFFEQKGWCVHGIDNNMRRDFFGADGDTTANLQRLRRELRHFTHHHLDIRDRQAIFDVVKCVRPALVIHCAAQPSHDLAKERPFDDFEINALGTLNLLEATRQFCAESSFILMSTNKVYGDAPNERPLQELPTRWDYSQPEHYCGIDEACRIDRTMHSLFGASKLAADVMVQEYGRYFAMPTVSFRGGCLTGAHHSAAEQHGFLAYLARCVKEERPYRIYGYKGKQVRDNIHAVDVCRAFAAFAANPRCGAVYNIGGGRANSVSVLEAIALLEDHFGKKLTVEQYAEPRKGDHICYISDMSRFHRDYPHWQLTFSLAEIIRQF